MRSPSVRFVHGDSRPPRISPVIFTGLVAAI
jgi:hypothetical protein